MILIVNRAPKNKKTANWRSLFAVIKQAQKNLRESVELCGKLALLSCSVVLVKNTLSDSLVNLLDSSLIGFACECLVTCCESCFILLDGSLHGSLEHLVLQSLCIGNENALLCGLNIRQIDSPPSQNGQRYLAAKHLPLNYTTSFQKFQVFFEIFSKKIKIFFLTCKLTIQRC